MSVVPPKNQFNTTEIAIEKLKELIQRRKMKTGERFYTGRELREMLGLSGYSIREAIKILVITGILESKKGVGTFIAKKENWSFLNVSEVPYLTKQNHFSEEEIFEARMVVQSNIAALAAEKRESDDLIELAEELAEMYSKLDSVDEFTCHSRNFHQQLAASSFNRILVQLFNLLSLAASGSKDSIKLQNGKLKEIANAHRAIYQAIRDGNSEKARRSVTNYLLSTAAANEKQLKLQNW